MRNVPIDRKQTRNLNILAAKPRRGDFDESRVIPFAKYRHFKGGLYRIICIGADSNNIMTITYYAIMTDHIWTKKVGEWMEPVADIPDGIRYRLIPEGRLSRFIAKIKLLFVLSRL